MKKFILAAFVAVPLLALQQQKASAGNECLDLAKWLRYRFCTCMHEKAAGHGHFGSSGCAGCNNGGGNGGCGCNCFGCNSTRPGPWYLYFPYNGQTLEIAGYGPAWPGGWSYEGHFQYPAPWGNGNWAPSVPASFTPSTPNYFAVPGAPNMIGD